MALSRRKVRDADEARGCLKAIEESGLSFGEWTERHGIDGRSLQRWRQEAVAPLRLVELTPLRQRPAPESPLSLALGDVTITIPVGFDEATLVGVLRAVRSC